MKAKRNLLIGLVFGTLIGWVMGFLRIPYLEKNHSFWLGILACLTVLSLGLIFLFVWNKHRLLLSLIGKNVPPQDLKKANRSYSFIWIWVSVFVVSGGLVIGAVIFKQNELFRTQVQNQNKRLAQQSELMESLGKSSLVYLMGNLLDKVDEELSQNPKKTLTEETIARIAALSYGFQPYRYITGDSLSVNKISPERGQLLLALSMMNIDSSSFAKIKRKATFSGANLKGADLSGKNLDGIDLNGADLSGADLSESKLNKADLRAANLWGARMNQVELKGSNLKRARFAWAELNGAQLDSAVLSGADLSNAKFKKADLSGTTIKWANLSDAFFMDANFAGAYILGTKFNRSNLSRADLTNAYFSLIELKEANLTGAEVQGTEVNEDNWLELLEEWQVTGAKEMQEKYKVVEDLSLVTKHRIEKINN